MALAAVVAACHPHPPAALPQTGLATPSGLQVDGDPTSAGGATWRFRGTREGVRYDLQGVLYAPAGPGPFPAVVLSHGFRGNAAFYARGLAPEMVRWGLVCIAPNYTHASGVPMGAPGGAGEPGASTANLRRAHMTYLLLRDLGYVDMSRVAAHGHSMGAFVTAALVSAYPTDFRVASHTGGGLRRPEATRGGPGPSESQVSGIRVPYQMHHGERDTVVPLVYEERLASVLQRHGVRHELIVYPGADHMAPSRSPLMLRRVREWYAAAGLF